MKDLEVIFKNWNMEIYSTKDRKFVRKESGDQLLGWAYELSGECWIISCSY